MSASGQERTQVLEVGLRGISESMINEIFKRLAVMPVDFWILLLAIFIFSLAILLILLAKGNRYKNYDKDGRLFVPLKIDVSLDAIESVHDHGGYFDEFGGDVDHH